VLRGCRNAGALQRAAVHPGTGETKKRNTLSSRRLPTLQRRNSTASLGDVGEMSRSGWESAWRNVLAGAYPSEACGRGLIAPTIGLNCQWHTKCGKSLPGSTNSSVVVKVLRTVEWLSEAWVMRASALLLAGTGEDADWGEGLRGGCSNRGQDSGHPFFAMGRGGHRGGLPLSGPGFPSPPPTHTNIPSSSCS